MRETDTTFSGLDQLERRIQRASAGTPQLRPWVDDERHAILGMVRQCLGIRDEWTPTIEILSTRPTEVGGIHVELLAATSWQRCYASAHLYLPSRGEQPLPVVLLCCGHAAGAKSAPGYVDLARRLARRGAAVLVLDNIGHGERQPMGHRDVVAPFQCGMTLQGMIVMETAAWLRWLQGDPRFDSSRIAAVGNSGGGTLTTFLGAMYRDELAALSSSGYPSTFEFVARKEKKHCHCNILTGVIGKIEMWHVLGAFGPKPLFLFQGNQDHFFPEDLFYAAARRVTEAYRRMEADGSVTCRIFEGGHSWDDQRRSALTEFLSRTLAMPAVESASGDSILEPTAGHSAGTVGPAPESCFESWPQDALTADELALTISGTGGEAKSSLADVFVPGDAVKAGVLLERVEARQLAAQWLAFLGDGRID